MKSLKYLLKVIFFILLLSDICFGSGIKSNVPKVFSGVYFFGKTNDNIVLLRVADLSNRSFREVFPDWLKENGINSYSPELSGKVMGNLNAAVNKAWGYDPEFRFGC